MKPDRGIANQSYRAHNFVYAFATSIGLELYQSRAYTFLDFETPQAEARAIKHHQLTQRAASSALDFPLFFAQNKSWP